MYSTKVYSRPVIYLDIETIPTSRPDVVQQVRDEAIADLNAKADAIASQYKKPETIDKHMASLPCVDDMVRERMSRMALDGATCEVVCIGMALEEDNLRFRQFMHRAPEYEDEESTIRAAVCAASEWNTPPFFVGHNLEWDLRILRQRCMYYGIRLGDGIFRPDNRDTYGCTMREWCGYRDRISFDALCRALGVTSPKQDMIGADVWAAWQAGEYNRIAEYNRADVMATAECWRKLTFQRPMCRVPLYRPAGGES